MVRDSATGLASARVTVTAKEKGLDAGSATDSGLVSATETDSDAGLATDSGAVKVTESDADSAMASDVAKASAMDAEPASGSVLIEKVCLPCRVMETARPAAYSRAYRRFQSYARL